MSIRKITPSDRAQYLAMAKEFYSSEAVLHPVPESNFETAFAELCGSDRRICGYIIELEGQTAGYALLARFFSQEAGGEVIWFDELYVREAFRGKGLGSLAMKEIFAQFPDAAAFRLEIEPDNDSAKRLYERLGFGALGYAQMLRPGKHNI